MLLNTDEPTNICTSCILSLDSWVKFKLLCDNTNAFLQQYRQDKNDSDLVVITFKLTLKIVVSIHFKLIVNFMKNCIELLLG